MSVESAEALLKRRWLSKKALAEALGVSLVSAGRYIKALRAEFGDRVREASTRQGLRGPQSTVYTMKEPK